MAFMVQQISVSKTMRSIISDNRIPYLINL